MPAGRVYVCLLLCSCFAPSLAFGGIVYYSVSPLSIVPGDFHHTYHLPAFDPFQYGELDFVFPPDLFFSLSSPLRATSSQKLLLTLATSRGLGVPMPRTAARGPLEPRRTLSISSTLYGIQGGKSGGSRGRYRCGTRHLWLRMFHVGSCGPSQLCRGGVRFPRFQVIFRPKGLCLRVLFPVVKGPFQRANQASRV
jgi:hypothetical protein